MVAWVGTCVLSCFSARLFCDLVDCSPPGSPVHGILQERILEWEVVPSSMGSSWLRKMAPASLKSPALAGGFFTTNTTWEACLSQLSLSNWPKVSQSQASLDLASCVPGIWAFLPHSILLVPHPGQHPSFTAEETELSQRLRLLGSPSRWWWGDAVFEKQTLCPPGREVVLGVRREFCF